MKVVKDNKSGSVRDYVHKVRFPSSLEQRLNKSGCKSSVMVPYRISARTHVDRCAQFFQP